MGVMSFILQLLPPNPLTDRWGQAITYYKENGVCVLGEYGRRGLLLILTCPNMPRLSISSLMGAEVGQVMVHSPAEWS